MTPETQSGTPQYYAVVVGSDKEVWHLSEEEFRRDLQQKGARQIGEAKPTKDEALIEFHKLQPEKPR